MTAPTLFRTGYERSPRRIRERVLRGAIRLTRPTTGPSYQNVSLTAHPLSADTPPPATQRPVTDRWASVWRRLGALFSSDEVDRDPRLKIICGCLLLYYHMTFAEWWDGAASLSTLGNELFNYAPAPVFENLRWLVFMDVFQTRTYFYALGMLALVGLFSLFVARSSRVALGVLAWLFLNKVFFYLCDFRLFANFHHFHLLYTLAFLLAHDKLRFFRLTLAVSYVMSGIVKLTPSWLSGEYFNSLPDKLPMLPKVDWIVTAACVGVTVLELIGPVCWFTGIRWLRRLTFGAFVLFHIYSGVIVGYWYTTLMLPLVVAAFWGFNEPLQKGYRFSGRHLAPMGLCAVALLGSLYQYVIPGDVRLTAEGRYFGLFMFDAGHSVRFEVTIRRGDKRWIIQMFRNWQFEPGGKAVPSRMTCVFHQDDVPVDYFEVVKPVRDGQDILFNPGYFTSARMRMSGDPYLYYFYARELVKRCHPDQVSIVMEQRLDGHPETVTLIDIPDFAERDPAYHSFTHNDWIQLNGPGGPTE